MSEEIIKVLDALASRFGLVIDWTSANVLPYIEELAARYISYKIATSVYYIVLWLIFAVIAWIFAAIAASKANKIRWNNSFAWTYIAVFGLIAAGACALTFLIVSAVQAYYMVTCATFPEKLLIDYAMTLLNGGC